MGLNQLSCCCPICDCSFKLILDTLARFFLGFPFCHEFCDFWSFFDGKYYIKSKILELSIKFYPHIDAEIKAVLLSHLVGF